MPEAGLRGRPTEDRSVKTFLTSTTVGPSALLIEGEPGIGKTTLWLAAIEEATARGFRVLSTRAAAAESVLAYTALADMLDDVDPHTWADLPAPQLLAVDQVLLRAGTGEVTDQRAVAAAFLAVIERHAEIGPVLLAIDDLQWLDPSSVHVIAFVARRLTGPVGILGSVRTEVHDGASAAWLQLPRPEALTRIRLSPLNVRELHSAVSSRLQRPFSRPAMGRIHQVSGGNPFYAIELARALDDGTLSTTVASLPRTLNDVVRSRLGSLDPDVHEALLAASCMATPTVETVAMATIGDGDQLVDLLEIAEGKGIISIDGNRIHFTHPLLARGVYTEARPATRRAMHRRLAELVDETELRARHLALAATRGDDVTLRALDKAADSARARGAPEAAAELMDLAIGLGGDAPERRLRSALNHFDAGDHERATTMLEETVDRLPPGDLRAEALCRLAVVRLYTEGFFEATTVLQQALNDADDNSPLRVQVLITLAYSLMHANQVREGKDVARQAVEDAERLGQPHLLSLALGMRVMLDFVAGEGFDSASLQRALELEDEDTFTPLVFRPRMQHALLLEWTGELAAARQKLEAIRLRCMEKGEEGEYVFIAQHVVMSSVWAGDFINANLVAEDAMERARQLSGGTPLFLAHSMRAPLAVFAGQEDEARRTIAAGLEIGRQTGTFRLGERLLATLAFLEVSLGNYPEALAAVAPLLSGFDPASTPTELPGAAFLPDAIESLVQLGRLAEAAPLIEALERNGRTFDRAWMSAVGARGRAMTLAATGDLAGAHAAAQQAMTEHERVDMPFDRARTLLLLGQLERRMRKKEAASRSLQMALEVFERHNVPLWANRTRAELARANVGPQGSSQLTPSEQRVAELAASGMKNRDVANALFISPKTVEANLARIYRKLGIRSRAELGRHIGRV
ncbi:helix-turn-helix transcriptional regulator [Mycolicibacterium tusciae]|uniref:LuxR family transcriptional regulator n=1 Tax=Mycolicibacterium tusciae TaxID=75922 RepID=A0A1X0JN19_9MYCO|nr:LuxR family transcriptional regulator [Mycolicibacterium tusciae]ORB64328.1 LuxR family transcriptional regulator [Mycolicibacterium tusciae]